MSPDTYLARLDGLIRRGRELKGTLPVDPSRPLGAARLWQQDCGTLVNELSGGSKAHWLARAYSSAFLMRSPTGGAIVEAPASDIVDRILAVLEQAEAQLRTTGMVPQSGDAAPAPRRFEFVHNLELRPVLEQAHRDSRRAFEEGRFDLALMTSCGILEAVITDALESAGCHVPDWSFDARIDAAEKAGLIRNGCARLPPVARRYRDLTNAAGALRPDVSISEREARLAGQVLLVIMRDLDPGR